MLKIFPTACCEIFEQTAQVRVVRINMYENARLGLIMQCQHKALAKLPKIARQTLLFISESSAIDKKITPDLRRKQ